MRTFLATITLCLFVSIVTGQETDYKTEVGLNMTQMVTQFIPFTNQQSAYGPFAVTWRRKINNQKSRFFQFSMGVNSNGGDDGFVNIQLGLMRKRSLSDRFEYSTSYNLLLSAGGLNIPNQDTSELGGIGLDFSGGIAYKLYKGIALGVDTHFIIIPNFSGGIIIVPPIGLFLLARF